jgi:hypothetical protein
MTTKAQLQEFNDKCVGMRFGSWVVIGQLVRDKHKVISLPVRCDCGTESVVSKHDLLKGKSKRCIGCAGTQQLGSKHVAYGSVAGCDLRSICKGARKRNIEFAVCGEYLHKLFENQGGLCALTGVPLEAGVRVKRGAAGHGHYSRAGKTRSLDRIDSSKGYVEGNVQWVHKDINVAKGVLSNDDFVSMCLNVIVHMTKGLVNV